MIRIHLTRSRAGCKTARLRAWKNRSYRAGTARQTRQITADAHGSAHDQALERAGRIGQIQTQVAQQTNRGQVGAEQALEAIEHGHHGRVVAPARPFETTQGGQRTDRPAPVPSFKNDFRKGGGIQQTEIDALPRQRMDAMRGINSQISIPGTMVLIGLNSPRISAGASGFRSYISR